MQVLCACIEFNRGARMLSLYLSLFSILNYNETHLFELVAIECPILNHVLKQFLFKDSDDID